jgi:hypothetical protein
LMSLAVFAESWLILSMLPEKEAVFAFRSMVRVPTVTLMASGLSEVGQMPWVPCDPGQMAYDLHLADRVRTILRAQKGLSERAMFGGVAFMINGHMCCGVTKTDLVVRLAPEDVVAALKRHHVRPMDFTGKPMKSMIFVAPPGSDSDADLDAWVEAAVAFANSLPGKTAAAKPRARVLS